MFKLCLGSTKTSRAIKITITAPNNREASKFGQRDQLENVMAYEPIGSALQKPVLSMDELN
jgi:hypothetical protein